MVYEDGVRLAAVLQSFASWLHASDTLHGLFKDAEIPPKIHVSSASDSLEHQLQPRPTNALEMRISRQIFTSLWLSYAFIAQFSDRVWSIVRLGTRIF